MNRFGAVLWMEILKVKRTKVFPATILFFIFIGIMMGLLMYLSLHPGIASRSAAINAKMSFLSGSDWKAFFDLLLQINLILGVIGGGIITAWCFGREFSDRVIKDLLALPVSRASIIIAKLIVLFVWTVILVLVALLSGIITGLFIGLPGLEDISIARLILKYIICAVLNAFLITPVAFIASVGRGYILPIAFVILIMILTQLLFLGVPAFSYWFPWALPALYSGVAGEAIPAPGIISYLIYMFTVLLGLFATIYWWRFADQK
ncbi:MAG: ABC transporter permease [Bacteroidales bacterium]|nr:ABC transporter permease [Bacteroidales bacterium]